MYHSLCISAFSHIPIYIPIYYLFALGKVILLCSAKRIEHISMRHYILAKLATIARPAGLANAFNFSFLKVTAW